MAYTILFNNSTVEKRDGILAHLQARLLKDGRFRATLTPTAIYGKGGKVSPAIVVKPVRLVKAKFYCGAHFGPCPVGTPKKKATYLEFSDWVKFHNLINRCLNRFRANADVWSTPMEGGVSKMWIRKGTRARVKWDVEEVYDDRGRHIGAWNYGTDDQFQST